MENFFATIFSGVSGVTGKLLGHPLDFLAGKSCNTKCKPAWDFICYIENFCVSLLIKSAMVIVLLYFVVCSSLILVPVIQIGSLSMHLSHSMQKSTDMFWYVLFNVRMLLRFLLFKDSQS